MQNAHPFLGMPLHCTCIYLLLSQILTPKLAIHSSPVRAIVGITAQSFNCGYCAFPSCGPRSRSQVEPYDFYAYVHKVTQKEVLFSRFGVRGRQNGPMNSIIGFFALDRLLPWVVAVSTDPARDSALPRLLRLANRPATGMQLYGSSASRQAKIVLNPNGLGESTDSLETPMLFGKPAPFVGLSWPPWTMRFARISHTAACPPYSRSGWPFVSRPFW